MSIQKQVLLDKINLPYQAEVLGEGKTSKLYKLHREDGVFALKTINISTNQSGKDRDLFLKEAMIMAILSHDNVIKLHGKYFERDQFKLVLEYCNAGDLKQLIHRNGKISSISLLRDITRQLTVGLAYLHDDAMIVHRDIKPSNILINVAGKIEGTHCHLSDQLQIKIADFGQSHILSQDECLNNSVGTLLYMAPEIISCYSYSQKTDIWSLGVTLFELATGQTPFTGHSRSHIKKLIKIGSYRASGVEGLPDQFFDFIGHCLQFDSDMRFSASELLTHPFLSSTAPLQELRTVRSTILLNCRQKSHLCQCTNDRAFVVSGLSDYSSIPSLFSFQEKSTQAASFCMFEDNLKDKKGKNIGQILDYISYQNSSQHLRSSSNESDTEQCDLADSLNSLDDDYYQIEVPIMKLQPKLF